MFTKHSLFYSPDCRENKKAFRVGKLFYCNEKREKGW